MAWLVLVRGMAVRGRWLMATVGAERLLVMEVDGLVVVGGMAIGACRWSLPVHCGAEPLCVDECW